MPKAPSFATPTGTELVRRQSLEAAQRRLSAAALLAEAHVKRPAFQTRMGRGATAVLVRFEWPGRLIVLEPATGAVLAESEPGKPYQLRDDFSIG